MPKKILEIQDKTIFDGYIIKVILKKIINKKIRKNVAERNDGGVEN